MKYINVLEQYSKRINRTKDQLTNVKHFYATKEEKLCIERAISSLSIVNEHIKRLMVLVNEGERFNVEIKNNPQIIDGNEIS